MTITTNEFKQNQLELENSGQTTIFGILYDKLCKELMQEVSENQSDWRCE